MLNVCLMLNFVYFVTGRLGKENCLFIKFGNVISGNVFCACFVRGV